MDKPPEIYQFLINLSFFKFVEHYQGTYPQAQWNNLT